MRNEYLSIPFLTPVAALMPKILTADFTHEIVNRDYLIQTHLPGIPGAAVLTEVTRTQEKCQVDDT